MEGSNENWAQFMRYIIWGFLICQIVVVVVLLETIFLNRGCGL